MVAGAAVSEQVDRRGVDVVVLICGGFLLQAVDQHLEIRLRDAAEQLVGFGVVQIDHRALRSILELSPTGGSGMRFAEGLTMRFPLPLGRYASRRATRRLVRELPWVGGAVVLFTVGRAIHRKGMLGGTLDTALD